MAAAAHAAGVGATIRVSLGGHHAPEICGYPLEEEAEVVSLSDGRWVLTAFTVGVEQDVGPMAGCLHYAAPAVSIERNDGFAKTGLGQTDGTSIRI